MVIVYSPEHPGKTGLTPYGLTYSLEMYLYALGSRFIHETRKGYRVAMRNCNAAWGCWNDCVYCYVMSLVRRHCGPFPTGVLCANPLQLPAALRGIENSRRWLQEKALFLSTTTDAFIPGATLGASRQVISTSAEYGVPVVTLAKQTPDPSIFPLKAREGFAVVAGWTITCLEDLDSCEIEPRAPSSSERFACLEATTAYLAEANYPACTWVSLTPLHTLSGDPHKLATRAFECGAEFCVAEPVHPYNNWCREHRIRDENVEAVLESLLDAASEAGRPVFLKDEFRKVALTHDRLAGRYLNMVKKAIQARWPGDPRAEELVSLLVGVPIEVAKTLREMEESPIEPDEMGGQQTLEGYFR